MVVEIIVAMLWSISPLGEAKVGIPYAIFNGVNSYVSFVVCFAANICAYPVMSFFLTHLNRRLMRWNFYRKASVKTARRIKNMAGSNIEKYGFWGILIVVMLPIPGTGVYAGTIASHLFKLPYKKAFWANTVGIFLSCIVVWSMTMATYHGVK